MLKTPRTLPERFNAPESALHQNQEKCPPCRARCPHRTLHLKDHAKGGDTPQGRPPEPPPKAFPPPGGRWHGEAVTDEGCPSAGIGGRGGSGTRPYATPQIQELRAGAGPPLQRTEGELCAIQGPLPHRAAHPDGAGHRSPCSTETRPRSPSYPSPQNCQQAEGSRPPPASLFPITWACRCTAGHSTTDGSA